MNILHIDCSPRDASHSRRLSAAVVARLQAEHPDARVTRRDLGRDSIPHAEPDYASALASPEALAIGLKNGATHLSEKLILELEDADALVIGTPMNNFTVPSVLKAWIDQIVRIGRSFAPSPDGVKVGLLRDRPVYIAIASGGLFTGNDARQPDFLTPYLAAALGCVGLTRLQFLSLQGTAFRTPTQLAADEATLLAALQSSR